MSNGSGPIRMPIRIIAGVLGVYLGTGGLLLAFGGLSVHWWQAALAALTSLWLAYLLLRAAVTGSSPAWPD
jgi:hypothetical protein